MADKVYTNRSFAAQDQEFQRHCTEAGVLPTGRQASKYRNKKGAAYSAKVGKSPTRRG